MFYPELVPFFLDFRWFVSLRHLGSLRFGHRVSFLKIQVYLNFATILSNILSATSRLFMSGKFSVVPSLSIIVTLLVSAPKPQDFSVISLATIKSRSFRCSFSVAFFDDVFAFCGESRP